MNRNLRRHASHGARTFMHLFAASLLTVAGAHLVQAQTQAPSQSTTTRAQTKAELKTLEKNGYEPSAQDPHYPDDIQKAEKKASAGKGASGPMVNPQ
ncbi:hypothetical protein P3T18_003336 [Paraburkholderia sp. GAS199]|uniref:DUF4148 domain-containing protein n=1 Tax=Paraburkholderia sp. GAS199 TaxID=3035126 RepID=UPI003D1DCF27